MSGRPKTPARKGNRAATLLRFAVGDIHAMANEIRGGRWPSTKWQKDPVGFVSNELGEKPLRHQRKIMRRVASHVGIKVAVRSGQKSGKTKLDIWLALWFYCCFEEAQVTLMATTREQVERVLWRELVLTIGAARRRKDFDVEIPFANPATGMKSDDGRVIRGFTVREVEALGGLSGKNQLIICDEASSLSEKGAEAVIGNMAGGARLLWTGNPTRSEGPFFEAFHARKQYWSRFHLNTEKIGAYNTKHKIDVPGVATLETVRGWKEEYGEDSPFYIVRVRGDFLMHETGKVVDLYTITMAQERYAETPGGGVLSIGVDPAGPGDGGDEFAFCIRRGLRVLGIFCFRGLTEDAAIAHVRGFVAEHRAPGEIPRVIVDSTGPIGSALYGRLRGLATDLQRDKPAESFDVYGVNASHYARRQPLIYDRVREELWKGLADWLKAGGAFPPDHKLERELHAPSWSGMANGKLKVTEKTELRVILEGRSPDRADALCLAVWEPAPWLAEAVEEGHAAAARERERAGASVSTGRDSESEGALDPHEGGSNGGRGGGFDPYGG